MRWLLVAALVLLVFFALVWTLTPEPPMVGSISI